MNADVGPRKVVSARERPFHRPRSHWRRSYRFAAFRTARLHATIALTALLGCAPLAWSQNTGSQAPAAGTGTAAAPAHKPAKAKGTEAKPGDAKSQASYSLGVSMGDQLHHLGLSADSISSEHLLEGLRDALAGKVQMSAEYQGRIAELIKTARNGLADKNHSAAKEFLAENGKKKDVVTTASGLQYHVISPGDGASPKATDQVTVNYRGTLLDGTEFDSSYKRGQPAQFPVNGVIPGWQEALVLMKPGAKWELFVPPNLAYDVNSPPAIPPGSLLKFEVELIKVNQPTAAAPGAKPSQSQ